MNADRVVSVILGSDEDSDWNSSGEEDHHGEGEDSFRLDQLSLEQHGKNGGQISMFCFTNVYFSKANLMMVLAMAKKMWTMVKKMWTMAKKMLKKTTIVRKIMKRATDLDLRVQ